MLATSNVFSTSTYVEIAGIKIRYKVGGAGKQILLLHGWGGSIESFELFFDRLAKFYEVFVLDLPGHGKSGLPPKAWSVSDYSNFVRQVMDTLKLTSPHIIAHSFGGRVAIKLAAAYPERVGKLILANSAGIRTQRSPKYYLRVFLAKMGKYLAKSCGQPGKMIRDRIYQVIESRDYANAGPLRETFIRVVNEDLRSVLPDIKSPTLLIWGEEDKETPVSSGRLMKRLIPIASLSILKNAGHFSYIDQSGKFYLIAEKFLRE
ncbi:MAG: alpha/beta hydrolase [Deltaproteobacteria bacterium]|nr:alpha/beta hydrolase [Deltaproteobacteria bacterium]